MTLAISHGTLWMHPIQSHGAEHGHFATVLLYWPSSAASLCDSAPGQRDPKEQSADESKGGSDFVPKMQFSSRPVHTELLHRHKGSIWAHNLVHSRSAGHPPADFCQLAVARLLTKSQRPIKHRPRMHHCLCLPVRASAQDSQATKYEICAWTVVLYKTPFGKEEKEIIFFSILRPFLIIRDSHF